MYTFIYRVGGRDNFQWRLTNTRFATAAEARAAAADTKAMGYPVRIHRVAALDAIGLPETFE